MRDIVELNNLFELNRENLEKLKNLNNALNEFISSGLFVSESVRCNFIDCLEESSVLEEKLKNTLLEFDCTKQLKGISDVEKEISRITEQYNYETIIDKLSSVKCLEKRYERIFENLKSESFSAIEAHNYDNEVLTVAKAFLQDVTGQTSSALDSIDDILESKYTGLLVAVMKNAFIIENDETDFDTDVNTSVKDEDEDELSDKSEKNTPYTQNDNTILSVCSSADSSNWFDDFFDESNEIDVSELFKEEEEFPEEELSEEEEEFSEEELSEDEEEFSEEELSEDEEEFSEEELSEDEEEFSEEEFSEEEDEEEEPEFEQSEFEISYSVTEAPARKKFSISEALNLVTIKNSKNRTPNVNFIYVIYSLGLFGALSKNLLRIFSERIKHCPSIDYDQAIEKLFKNRIICEITISDKEEPLYCLTSNGKKFFDNQKFKQAFFRKPFEVQTRSAEVFEINDYDVAASAIFEKLFTDYNELYEEIEMNGFADNITGLRNYIFDGNFKHEYFITAMTLINDETMSVYIKNLSSVSPEEMKSAKFFVIGSVDLGSCRFICGKLKENFGEPFKNTAFIGYSYADKLYYNLDNDEPTDFDYIKHRVKNTDSESEDNSEFVSDDESISSSLETEYEDEDETEFPETDSDTAISSEEDLEEAAPYDFYDPYEDEEPNQLIDDIQLNEKYISNVTYEEAFDKVQEMLISGSAYAALAYLKTVSPADEKIEYLYRLLAFAYDDPMLNKTYDSNEILSLMEHVDYDNDFIRSLLLAATMRNVFYNDNKYDHSLKVLESTLPDTKISEIKTFIRKCIDFKTQNNNGFDAFCDYRKKEQIDARNEINKVSKMAEAHYDINVIQPFREKTKIKRYRNTVKTIFNRDGDLAYCLEIVAQNDSANLDIVTEFIRPFIKGDSIDENKINEDEIYKLIDETWEKCCESEVIYHSTQLMSGLRRNLKNKIEKAVVYIAAWVRLYNAFDGIDKPLDFNNKTYLIHLLNEIINICRKEADDSREKSYSAGLSCISAVCRNLISRLDGSFNSTLYNKFFYIDFLKTGDIMLSDSAGKTYLPDLRNYCYGIKGFTVVDRIFKNYETCRNLDITDSPAVDFDTMEYCDIGAMRILIDYYGSKYGENSNVYKSFKEIVDSKETNLNSCTQFFTRLHSEFIEHLELKKSYGAFDANNDDDIKEILLRQSENLYCFSKTSQNYGFYQRGIKCIKQQIYTDSETQRTKIKNSLKELETDDDILEQIDSDETLKKAIAKIGQYIEKDNFTAAEDLINRVISKDLIDSELEEPNKDLVDFQKCYHELYMSCTDAGEGLKNSKKVNNLIDRYNYATKDKKSGKLLCAAWIANRYTADRMKTLLSLLGMECDVSENFDKQGYKHSQMYFDCKLKGNLNTEGRFSHVIAPFGSYAHTSSFRTLCLFGKNDDDRLFTEIDKLTAFGKSTIIFVDYAFNEQFRRKLSDKIKRGRYGEVYMVVDRVMLLYLATHYQKESVIGKFINIAMPYSYYQPYVYDSMSKMPPEMFFGRTTELQDIESRNGIHMLYGGRQLGKSALLKRARLDIDGQNNKRAVYIDIKNKNVLQTAEKISYELVSIGLFGENEKYTDWESLCRAIKSCIKRNNIDYFLLLLDEGDVFIDDCANYEYQPIDEMKHIMDDINFKFVIAGLHNLARYKHASTIADNSVIPHLKTLTIKPFRYSEAKKLLEVPLSQVGLFFNNDALISTILATTNYFPGLIQLYCSKLVESLQNIDTSIYPINSVPPYYVNEKHIQKILANEEFTKQIKEKFEITLALDKDNYYQIIALLMAEMYHSGDVNGYSVGYKAEDVYERGVLYEIKKIAEMDIEVFTAYMDELVELNIFRKHPDGSYTFLRQNFFQLMGNKDEIYDNLQKYIDAI